MRSVLLDVLQLFFRMVPHPTRPRLIVIGKPGRGSPVLVTTNSSLTVRRLEGALRSESLYLLVAPAGGINVWCGSVGGHFTIEGIISIIKTSGIQQLVDHRRLILPQLCAPAITSKELIKRVGWSAQFGPVRAADIPAYLRNGRKLTPAMTEIQYSINDRVEMSIAMSGSIIVRFSIFPLFLWGIGALLQFVAAVFCSSILLHVLNERIPGSANTRKSFYTCAVSLPLLAPLAWSVNPLSLSHLLSLATITLGASYLAGSAYSGYTPFKQCSYSKQVFGYKPLKIDIVADDCTGCTLCEWVCPVNCFDPVVLQPTRKVFVMARAADCVECAACLVQCPTNAVVDLFADAAPGRTACCS
jgi:NAD-dependent dihydropyrimidine dehydrogenase PreA subunit